MIILLSFSSKLSNSSRFKKIGLESDHRGMLKVNSSYQTEKKYIYAVGDVIGYPSLASVSYDQGRIVASHILEQKIDNHFQIMPNGIAPPLKLAPSVKQNKS